MIFFDIDGTLLNHDKNLPSSTKRAIKTLQGKGIPVAIATGRAPFMFKDLRDELNIDSFVSFNGQYVVFEGKPIYQNPLPKEELAKLVVDARTKEHPVVFLNEITMKANVDDHPHISESMASLKFAHPEHDDTFMNLHDLYQTLLFCTKEDEPYYREKYPVFTFIRWHPYSMDILPRGGSKAEGIKKMIEKLGIDMENVYAFGDGLNDIEMLETVGTGVAMGNAVDKAKNVAKMITASVEDNGIEKALVKLGLIDKKESTLSQ
jgi:Cof subfamily protein (haloacid dehalogenase superfamily)